MRRSETQRENKNQEGELGGKTKVFEGNCVYNGQEGAVGRWKCIKKRDRERGKQPSDEMPVMSVQVLMRAIDPVDAQADDVKQRDAHRRGYSPRKGELIKEAVPTKLQGTH